MTKNNEDLSSEKDNLLVIDLSEMTQYLHNFKDS